MLKNQDRFFLFLLTFRKRYPIAIDSVKKYRRKECLYEKEKYSF